ncbi:hypothetical protein BOTBODRAFT_56992 [Botryobasidium botryosum FD-172 SS1]|uniref:Uncharacterized protein n=1 Tax=Botryobasidium botryosum (strain FD-172 SS1) TaxID=930990 RepID=A0A067MKM8_BOTB1|nr:hypothetical protein BOTBODRAFT_56992 [Botryobasidium botryosum FD-172 SS1]
MPRSFASDNDEYDDENDRLDDGSWGPDGLDNGDLDTDFDSMASDNDDDDEIDFGGANDDRISHSSHGTDVGQLNNQFAATSLAAAPVSSRSMVQPQTYRAGGSNMCVICGIKPAYSQNGKSYPTCGLTCAAKYRARGTGSGGGSTSAAAVVIFCCVCGKKPAYNQGGKSYPTCGNTCGGKYKTGNFTRLCVICGQRPAYNQNGKSYPTCGLACSPKYKVVHGGAGGGRNSSTKLCVVSSPQKFPSMQSSQLALLDMSQTSALQPGL